MDEGRQVVIKYIGRDIYKMIIWYILRALRNQFNLLKPMKQWPNVTVHVPKQRQHLIFKYFAKHALITISCFYEFCREVSNKFTDEIRIQKCFCGETLGYMIERSLPNFIWIYSEKQRTKHFVNCDKGIVSCCDKRKCKDNRFRCFAFGAYEHCLRCMSRLGHDTDAIIKEWEKTQVVPF